MRVGAQQEGYDRYLRRGGWYRRIWYRCGTNYSSGGCTVASGTGRAPRVLGSPMRQARGWRGRQAKRQQESELEPRAAGLHGAEYGFFCQGGRPLAYCRLQRCGCVCFLPCSVCRCPGGGVGPAARCPTSRGSWCACISALRCSSVLYGGGGTLYLGDSVGVVPIRIFPWFRKTARTNSNREMKSSSRRVTDRFI